MLFYFFLNNLVIFSGRKTTCTAKMIQIPNSDFFIFYFLPYYCESYEHHIGFSRVLIALETMHIVDILFFILNFCTLYFYT